MANIIKLHGDDHRDVQLLLPWYATGRLDPADLVKVEAHLADCPECQADLAFERRLGAAIADLPQGAAEPGVVPTPAAARGRRRDGVVAAWLSGARRWRQATPWLGWALAAPSLMGLTLVALAPHPRPAGPYHALGAAPAPAAANIVVIFRPDAQERALRAVLEANGARLVDGPTAADAYLLHVPADRRAAALAGLRKDREVELAEAIDSGGPP